MRGRGVSLFRRLVLLALAAPAAVADVGVTIHGEVVEGAIRVEGDKVLVQRARRRDPDEWSRAEFYLIEKDDGTFVFAPDFEGRVRGYEYLAQLQRRDRLAELAADAVRARDASLARGLFEAAEEDGYTGKKADSLKRRLEKLEEKNASRNESKAKAIEKEWEEVKSIQLRMLVDRAQREAADSDDGLRLLRRALRVAPDDTAALALLRERAPGDFAAGDARFWLDFHLDLESSGGHLAPETLRELRMVRTTWRPDLYGVLAGPMRVFTPVKDTRTVGRCLAYGQLTCRVLADMFRTDKPMKRAADGLMVLLYSSKEEYMTVRGTGGRIVNPENLEWTTGYYSPQDRLSRVYWHTDRDAERRIAKTFCHELTHHWLQEYNPCYADSQLRRAPTQPGYWIVEGFATFIEEGDFDIETMTWTPFDGRAATLDVVQALSARKGALLPWEVVFRLNQIGFGGLEREKGVRFHRKWRMGEDARVPARLFYDQAAAACHFLYHGENGRFREKLVRYIIDYYTGRAEGVDVHEAFGFSEAELGARIEKFARDVGSGWRPTPGK